MVAFLMTAGVAIGLAMAAPLGPVNLIVIRTALNLGLRAAFMAGLGAVLGDVLMASIAAFGLRSIQHTISDYAMLLQIVGGLFLVIMGVKTARTHFASSDLTPPPHAARLGLTFSLTVTNPGTALGFLAVFSAMANVLQLGQAPYRPILVLAGVAAGGALWWLLLSVIISKLKSRLSTLTLDRINRWSGVCVAAFGFVLLLRAFD